MDRRLLLQSGMSRQTAVAHVGIRDVTGEGGADPLAKQALDAAIKKYGAERVRAIPLSAEWLRKARQKGHPVTHGYVLGTDGKILIWVEGQ